MAGLVWKGDQFTRKLKRRVFNNMGAVTQFMRNEVIKSINVSQPTRRVGRRGGRMGLAPSSPGSPPKRVEGDLVKSIVASVRHDGNAVVGAYGSTQAAKALALEFGSPANNLEARPFLRPPLFKNAKEIARILAR